MNAKHNIMFLVHDDYAALKAKGVDHMILERDEYGYFEKVITVHPLATKTQCIDLNQIHSIYEFNLRTYFYPNKFGLLMPLLPFKFMLTILQLIRLVKREKINAIRATDPYFMGLIAWIISSLTKIPFCISIHTDYTMVFSLTPVTGFKRFLRIAAKWIPDFVSPKAKLILPISHYLKKAVSKQVNTNKIKVIPHGIPFNFNPITDIRTRFNLPTDKKIISFVARLSKDNYIDDIITVIEHMSLKRNDFIFVMVGGGELEPFLNDWLLSHPELRSIVYLLGFQPNEIGRSLRHISTMSLCLMSGFSLIEAAAAGSPLISYDIEWHGELVESNVTGFLLKEHDLSALETAIIYLLENPEHASIMGVNAKNRAYAIHELMRTSQVKQQYYSEILGKSI